MEKAKHPLYRTAAHFARSREVISISRLQRQYRIGYRDAQELMEALAAAGVVSTEVGWLSTRQVLRPRKKARKDDLRASV